MVLGEMIQKIKAELANFYGPEEIRSFITMLFEGISKMGPTALHTQTSTAILSKTETTAYEKAIGRLKNHEPIQYILGSAWFYGLPFEVNGHTLIPRPETEELVHRTVARLKQKAERPLQLLDIGTGSGCVAISLAHALPQCNVSALDVSAEALKTAKKNAERNSAPV
ncbi:MAG: N5-glutamine methyltransferase family protein, partial [Marinirhabdus sp.]